MARALLLALLIAGVSSQLKAQDRAAGEQVFKQCNICHQVGESAKNDVGPALNGVFGKQAGTASGYSYSAGFRNAALLWDESSLREYIKDPRSMFPGTKMSFAGLKDERKIADLLAYLKQFGADGKRK
jgi:cytochrome c